MKAEKLLLDWFARQGWEPFAFQREVWQAYLTGESGLIHAATGTGKTYAAWLGMLIEWMNENPPPYKITKRPQSPPLQALWITPLRALAADTADALRAPINDLGLPWSLETRTGDTSSTIRSRQGRRLPTALVTTPESLALLLSREDAEAQFAHLKLVVIDEWHELMSSKRGVQVELALARLRRWQPDLRVWGLSATMGNLETALQVLNPQKPGRLVQGQLGKTLIIDSIIPPQIERFPWAGHLGLKLLPEVINGIENSQSTLVFTNTRSQTERWYQAILEERPEWSGEIALHHGSLDPATRAWVESALREGRLRCVVCTSSLDLGVDFAPVDRVFQIGSPKGIARLLQRAGRSGHQPGAVSRITCVPTYAFELIETAAVREAMQAGVIEDRVPIECPLDVLLQHMVTIALGGGFASDNFLAEVRSTYAYRQLSEAEWQWALAFLSSGGEALQAYPEYSRLIEKNGRYIVENKELARMHRMSIGTILGDATLTVQYLKGGKIGQIEESFVARLKRGDKFTLSGKVLEFVRVRDMKVWVRRAKSSQGVIPRWFGGRLPISDALMTAVRAKLEEARQGIYEDAELFAMRQLLDLQQRWSVIPAPHQLLIERVKTREGYHLFFFPFEGHMVHEGLAALLAYRLSRYQPITFTFSVNDYGLELLSPELAPLDQALDDGLFSPQQLTEDILASMNASEMARRHFREIARVAGLVFQRFPGGQKTAKQLQVSSSLLYDVLSEYDEGNRLLFQARREVLERQLDYNRLHHTLGRLHQSTIVLKDMRRLSPFAFPLWVNRLRQTVSSETLEDRIKKMQVSLEWAADHP